MPATFDADSDTVSLTASTLPRYVTVSGTTYTISPSPLDSGTNSITFTLNDGINSPVLFSLNIIVTPNSQPKFATVLTDQYVTQGHS